MDSSFWSQMFESSALLEAPLLPLPDYYSQDDISAQIQAETALHFDQQDAAVQALPLTDPSAADSIEDLPEFDADAFSEDQGLFFDEEDLDSLSADVMPPLFDLES